MPPWVALCQDGALRCCPVTQPPSPSAAITAQVRALRTERGWSARELAGRMTAEGVPWDRSVVANLETGRRSGLSVEEWLALARVLDVPPLHLLAPLDDDEPVAVTPNLTVPAKTLRAWIRGQRTPISESPEFMRHRPADERDELAIDVATLNRVIQAMEIETERMRMVVEGARERVEGARERLERLKRGE